jgi:hypothetical protein
MDLGRVWQRKEFRLGIFLGARGPLRLSSYKLALVRIYSPRAYSVGYRAMN